MTTKIDSIPAGRPETTSIAPEASAPAAAPQPARRGFAAMDRAKVREIAKLGGRASHEKGTAHRFSRTEAVEAGRKGGRAPHVRRGRARAAEAPAPVEAAPNSKAMG